MRADSLKIAVVDGPTEKTVYLYDNQDGWECSAHVAVRLPAFGGNASKGLREFLERALLALGETRGQPEAVD
jgi:hypothetical protein